MSSKTIIGVTVAVLIICASIVFITKNKKTAEVAQVPQQVNTEQAPPVHEATPPVSTKIPFDKFMEKGGTYACTIDQNVRGSSTTGTVWTAKNLVRGDLSASLKGVNYSASFIVRDGYTYSWGSFLPSGFKAKNTNSDGTPVKGNTYSWNAADISNYDCQPWKVETEKFTLPAGVEFKAI